jgi:putative RNA 2'-phosphotransferase
MTDKEVIRTSKFLSLILRHEPERVGLKLGDTGWVGVDELLKAVNGHGVSLTLE